MNDFHIKTEQFEGPMDLLLSLIEKRKLLVNDISLAKVTDDFIAHIQKFENQTGTAYLDKSAHFILIASTLLLIKSKSLLPDLALSEEEQHSIEDLEKRLKEYQRIKELSVHVNTLFGKKFIFLKEPAKLEPIFAPDPSMTLDNLFTALKRVIENLPIRKEKLPEVVVKQIMSLENMIEKLTNRITTGLKMTFKEFASKELKEAKGEKINVIVGFLAMLELVKNGILHVNQDYMYGDIHMETDKVGTPRYT